MELDRHKLEEERDWRFEHYQESVRRTVSTIVDAIQRDTKEALAQEIRYTDDIRGEYTYADQAARIQQSIIQALNNADFRGLLSNAADLHAVEKAIFTLGKLQESLPVEVRELMQAREDNALRQTIEEKRDRIREIEERDAGGCRAGVSSGRANIGRCQNKGAKTFIVDGRPGYFGNVVDADDPNAVEVKLCGTHAKQIEKHGHIHLYTPNDWSRRQHEIWERKSARELARLEARLPEAIEAADAPKQIGAGRCDECGWVECRCNKTALIIVDVQNDFLPGGALAVPNGDEVIEPIMELASVGPLDGRIDLVVASQDWHPDDHVSFEKDGGTWPVHCVAGTEGAQLHPEIERLNAAIVHKGFHTGEEAYSAFDGYVQTGESLHEPLLGDYLRDQGITRVVIAGLATDYCVKATALGARRLGFGVTLLADGCRGIDAQAHDEVLADERWDVA